MNSRLTAGTDVVAAAAGRSTQSSRDAQVVGEQVNTNDNVDNNPSGGQCQSQSQLATDGARLALVDTVRSPNTDQK